MDTCDILEKLADTVVAYVDGDEEIDLDTLRDVCVRSKALVAATRTEFSLEDPPPQEGAGITASDPVDGR